MVTRRKTLSDLRATASAAHRAVREEEDRQRHAYNDALEALHDELERYIGSAGWVVSVATRKHERLIKARPGWASKDVMVLSFALSEEFTPDLYEDIMATAVTLTDTATGDMCRFNQPPHADMLLALVEAYMKLASPPEGRVGADA